ncbi:LPP20 family lipoprotein [bacterium]|nr:LPP20 family lipoprotein [bacterium]
MTRKRALKPSARLALAAIALVLTLSPAPSLRAEVEETRAGVTVDWSDGLIVVTGQGVEPESGTRAQKRLMAERAALSDAYRKLAEATDGIRVEADTTVKNFAAESDLVRTQISGLIKGARIVETRHHEDGSAEVRVSLDLYGKGRSLAKAVLTQPSPKKLKPTGTVDSLLAPAEVRVEHTGLIVDARGLGLEPAMSPMILDESAARLYLSPKVSVDPEAVVNKGLASYASSLQEAQKLQRVGSNPLVLKAKRVDDRTNVVLDDTAAKQLLGADRRKGFLKDLAVVLVP